MDHNPDSNLEFAHLLGRPGDAALAGAASGRPLPRSRQPWGRLLRAVLDMAGDRAELVSHTERDWASATFSGSRHAITLVFTGPAAGEAGEMFIIALLDQNITIPRYLVADTQIIEVDDSQLPQRRLALTIEMLLLDQV